MKRPWKVILIFSLCLAVVFAVMAWVSVQVLRLDDMERQARVQGEREETVRLALWRMDALMTPPIARESARPYSAYQAFHPADNAFTKLGTQIQSGEIIVASELQGGPPPQVIVHFQIGPDGRVTSPQAPEAAPPGDGTAAQQDDAAEYRRRLDDLRPLLSRDQLLAALPGPLTPVEVAVNNNLDVLTQGRANLYNVANQKNIDRYEQQQALSSYEYNARQYVNSTVMNGGNLTLGGQSQVQQTTSQPAGQATGPNVLRLGGQRPERVNGMDISMGMSRCLWLNGKDHKEQQLVLARRVVVGSQVFVQGCLLDWPDIQRVMLEAIPDLPAAQLRAADPNVPDKAGRTLATLPVRLLPGATPEPPAAQPSVLRLSLLAAWGCLLLATTAVGVLLFGAVSLSQRRGDFVSAVTHELRTPLTTFRLYTDLLSTRLMDDEQKRARYLGTLKTEAERLSHLVENVLAYARLENGRPGSGPQQVGVEDAVCPILPRLVNRAEQAGMSLLAEGLDKTHVLTVNVDPSSVEHIVFNLVDNACKYAAAALDKRIHLEVSPLRDGVRIAVRDHGQGISAAEASRLFRPFSKSVKKAANSAPGVGLGLCLSRRLARRMGGDLTYENAEGGGARFVLTLSA